MDTRDFIVKVNVDQPETTVAVVRLLLGLGYENKRVKYDEQWIQSQKDRVGYIHVTDGMITGWDRPTLKPRQLEFQSVIDLTAPRTHTITIDGKEIIVSNESFLALKKSLLT